MSTDDLCNECGYQLTSSWKCCPNCGCDRPQMNLLNDQTDRHPVNNQPNSDQREIRIGIIVLACVCVFGLILAVLSVIQADPSFPKVNRKTLGLSRDFILAHQFTSLAVILVLAGMLLAWLLTTQRGRKSKASRDVNAGCNDTFFLLSTVMLWIFAGIIYYVETCCNMLTGR